MSEPQKNPVWPWIIGGLLLLNLFVGVMMFCAVLWIGGTFRSSPPIPPDNGGIVQQESPDSK